MTSSFHVTLSLWLCSLDLRSHQCLSHWHCMLKCLICQRISPVASVGSSFCRCRQSPACPCYPPLLWWHIIIHDELCFWCSWPQILPSLCSGLMSTTFLTFFDGLFLWLVFILELDTFDISHPLHITSSTSKSLSEMRSSHSETSFSTSTSEASLASEINCKALWAENLLAILISCNKEPHWQS